MRLSVRPGVRTRLRREFSRTIHRAPNPPESGGLCRPKRPYLRANRFQGAIASLTSTENACRTCVWCLPILFALPQRPRPGSGMLTGFPFDRRGGHEDHPLLNGVSLSLRSGSLTSHCGSRQTLLHFSLQSSHLNICYYHQYLH